MVEWFKGQFANRTSFMSWMGGLFVLFYLVITAYQIGQVNIFYNKGKIESEIFERINSSYFVALKDIVMIIVLFFFRNNNTQEGKINEAEK